MPKTNNAQPQAHQSTTSFPVPFTAEVMRKDAVEVFLHYVRWMARMSSAQAAWALTGAPGGDWVDLFPYAYESAEEIGLTYDRIRATPFAKAMEQFYDYAYLARLDADSEPMEDGSSHTWFAALLCDAAKGAASAEHDGYAGVLRESAERLLQMAETANARWTLGGGEPFFTAFQNGKDGYLEEGLLTIRQLALLSGMEEMSIRAAANPKRPNPLKTIATEQGTRVEIAVAKEWLQSKGRYLKVEHHWSSGEMDLAKQQFESLDLMNSMLHMRRMNLKSKGEENLEERLSAIGATDPSRLAHFIAGLDPDKALHKSQLTAIADLLQLPWNLLSLRAAEAKAKDTLKHVAASLRAISQSGAKT